ncbi:caprin-2-like [Ruditapes philippinarum]|uniref:caprin-2-like n=1 Tax=Ruditapes philippinarum TaxID=129788 RepID=UPI00295B0FF8|nr:caprin-2-like [Ruditapes philippinarum]
MDRYLFIISGWLAFAAPRLCLCNSSDSTCSKRLDELEKKIDSYSTLQEEVITLKEHVKKLEKRHLKEHSRIASDVLSLGPGKRYLEPTTTVAFSAFVDNNPSAIGLEQPVPFNRILTNVGGGYNQHTHAFTCPVTGLYMFTFTISHFYVTEFIAKLVVDNQNIVDAISQPSIPLEEIQGMNTAIIQVNKGQSVWVAVYYHSGITIRSDNTYRFATFSGFLIQA